MDKHGAGAVEQNIVTVVKIIDEVNLRYSLVGEFTNVNTSEVELFLEQILIMEE